VGGCQKLGDTCRMYQLTTELAERDSESKRARGVEIAQAEQLTELQKQHSGLSQNGPEKSCVQKSFKTSCMTQGSHIVADPIYAPSGGCNKNLLLLLITIGITGAEMNTARASGLKTVPCCPRGSTD
jgi:hypothetical protein